MEAPMSDGPYSSFEAAVEHVELLMNCAFWGFIIASCLLGMTLVQAFIYFKHYKDIRLIRSIVTGVVILDISSTALTAHYIYYYLIQNYNRPFALTPISFALEYLCTSLVLFLSQFFYICQIFLLHRNSSRKLAPAVVMAVFSLVALGSNIGTVIYTTPSYLVKNMGSVSLLTVTTTIASALGAVTDIMASALLCLFLMASKSDLGRKHTSLVEKLLYFTVNRGILFALAQVARMIGFLTRPGSFFWLPFHLLLSKLHSNSLLALLNNRQTLRDAALEASKIDIHTSQILSTDRGMSLNSRGATGRALRFADAKRTNPDLKISVAYPEDSHEADDGGRKTVKAPPLTNDYEMDRLRELRTANKK